MTVHPPIGKQSRYPKLNLTVIHAHGVEHLLDGSRSNGNY